ncbi:DUF4843 domain-containing protein [Carboxylicivirga mesophila]|uniref:DUF4843 domain-containing protein n=1 Tax=Carboxylicivirga mesophila TaxID=1166478 RepID=A0ABS5K666_9BACT|nr:DUF4843 domain-containing protein [Carboxylicivirga mesophila]MBS2210446.1 DUF4843 domain-containing protein [Carboxylicivirga mesophila]
MKFYKYILALSFALVILSCEENEPMLYDTNYNALNFKVADSLYVNYMFFPDDATSAVVKVNLKLMGQASPTERYYKIGEVADETTAEQGVHYETLKEQYAFPANTTEVDFELQLKRDESLRENTYRLMLHLIPGDDFKQGILDEQYFIINITDNLLVPPPFWERNYLHYYAGPYHWKKCKKYIEIAGVDAPNWYPDPYAAGDVYIKQTRKWFEENPTYDEDGNRLYFENR